MNKLSNYFSAVDENEKCFIGKIYIIHNIVLKRKSILE